MNVIDIMGDLIDKNQRNNDLTSDMLIHYYEHATPDEQKLINKITRCLCGKSFDVILKRAGIEIKTA